MSAQLSRIEGLGGKSPALAVQCPVCSSQVGVYCMKPNGGRQTIAHKKRRELAAFAKAFPPKGASSQPAVECPLSFNFTGGEGTHKYVSDGKCLWCHHDGYLRGKPDFAAVETRVLAVAPRATTDQDGQTIEVLILSERVSSTGLVKVHVIEPTSTAANGPIVRHRDRLSPLNAAARVLLCAACAFRPCDDHIGDWPGGGPPDDY